MASLPGHKEVRPRCCSGLIFAVLTAVVLYALLRPLAGGSGGEGSRAAFNATVYRDQLGEVRKRPRARPDRRGRCRGCAHRNRAPAARRRRRRARAPSAPQPTPRSEPWRWGSRSLCRSPRSVSISSTALPAFPTNPSSPVSRIRQATRISKCWSPASRRGCASIPRKARGGRSSLPSIWAGAAMPMRPRPIASRSGSSESRRSALRATARRWCSPITAWSPRTRARLSSGRVELDPTLIEPRLVLIIAKEQDGQFAAAIEDWRAHACEGSRRCALAEAGGAAARRGRGEARRQGGSGQAGGCSGHSDARAKPPTMWPRRKT